MYVLHYRYIPAWVKFSEYERARFLNSSLLLLWPAFDRAICNLLKAELEPLLQVQMYTIKYM